MVVLLFMIIIGSFLELLGISVILPVVNAIMYPEQILENQYFSVLYQLLNLQNTNQLIFVVLGGLILIYIVKNTFLIFMYSRQYHFIYYNQRILSGQMMKCYMDQPYLFHVSKNSAELLRNINQDTGAFFGALLACVQLVTELMVCAVLVVYLFIQDKTITISIIIIMAVLGLLFLKVYKKFVYRMGEKNRYYEMTLNKWVQQAFGGIKEVKVLNKEKFFFDSYDSCFAKVARNEYSYHTMLSIPKPVIETFCICGLLGAIGIKVGRGISVAYFVPIISVFAVAAFRLLPSFNRITEYMGNIIYNKSAVDSIYKDLMEVEQLNASKVEVQKNKEKIFFNNAIRIKKLTFKYPNTDKEVLKNVNLEIPKNSSVAFIGTSGAGKTTLADIILGILEPYEGSAFTDDYNIFTHLDEWHDLIGYIPQTIYLMDDSIRHNIAFGISEEEIDDAQIRQAVEQAQLSELIDELEDGINTEVGERGIRLSGGQRQRIGIARALYHSPQILVLDEATSALDNETEKAVMSAIEALQGKMTLIIIAHRLTTIEHCDYIYELQEGKAVVKKSPQN